MRLRLQLAAGPGEVVSPEELAHAAAHVLIESGVSPEHLLHAVAEHAGVDLHKATASSDGAPAPHVAAARVQHARLLHWYERHVLPSMTEQILAVLARSRA